MEPLPKYLVCDTSEWYILQCRPIFKKLHHTAQTQYQNPQMPYLMAQNTISELPDAILYSSNTISEASDAISDCSNPLFEPSDAVFDHSNTLSEPSDAIFDCSNPISE